MRTVREMIRVKVMKTVRRCHKRREAERGFTLMETAIALVILMIVGLGAASLFFYAAMNNTGAQDRELSMAVAQKVMETYRTAQFTSTTLNATAGTTSTITDAGRDYNVNVKIVDSNVVNGAATIKTITVQVTPKAFGPGWSRSVTSVYGSVTLTTLRSSLQVGPNSFH